MNKRIMIVICVVIAVGSFFGGLAYWYSDLEEIQLELVRQQLELARQQVVYEGMLEEQLANYETTIKNHEQEIINIGEVTRKLFEMPLKMETAYWWLDGTIAYHQSHVDRSIFTEILPRELHLGYINLYGEIKQLFIEFEAESYPLDKGEG